ncbi:MAG: GTP 3',8-cyclase MoaA [Phycisphaeraceae bacterium]|nr:GTP 3',8-cyclase MoaA [Phycisphaeraceae bacterium]
MTTPEARPTVSLRLSVTDRCQLGCLYCRPASGSRPPKCTSVSEPISFDDIAYFVELIQSHFSLSKVHLTGGEPLLRPNLVQLIRLLADQKLDLALTTNAQCLEKHASTLKQAGLKRVNVSLDSLNPATFANMTRGGDIQRTLTGIRQAKEVKLQPIKLNMTVLRGLNDHEVEDVARYGLRTGCEVRFLELMPIGPAQDKFDQFFVSAAEVHKRLAHAFALKPIEPKPGQSARRYWAQDSQGQKGVLGQIAPYTRPFCQGCRRLRLTSTGQLITCLASGKAIDLSSWLRQKSSRSERIVKEIVARELDAKCMRGSFDTGRSMVAVGG